MTKLIIFLLNVPSYNALKINFFFNCSICFENSFSEKLARLFCTLNSFTNVLKFLSFALQHLSFTELFCLRFQSSTMKAMLAHTSNALSWITHEFYRFISCGKRLWQAADDGMNKLIRLNDVSKFHSWDFAVSASRAVSSIICFVIILLIAYEIFTDA